MKHETLPAPSFTKKVDGNAKKSALFSLFAAGGPTSKLKVKA